MLHASQDLVSGPLIRLHLQHKQGLTLVVLFSKPTSKSGKLSANIMTPFTITSASSLPVKRMPQEYAEVV